MTPTGKPIRIAVDIGGTFTDLQILDERTGRPLAHKTATTPDDPSLGLIAGIRGAADRFGFALADIGLILHGTTIATNAILERKLPQGALITTAGFSDVLEIGRHLRKDIYRLRAEPRALLVPRIRRFGVPERMRADGTVEMPLDEAAVAGLAGRLAESDVGAVAVCFLHAYLNPKHERWVAEIFTTAAPDIAVSLSSDVSPEMREFERSSTTVLNALLMPVVTRYLERIESRLDDAGIGATLYLVQSNGGVTTPARAAVEPVRLLLSGPAGGAMAVAQLGVDLDESNLVAIDMGGTSSDVSLIRGGRGSVVTEGEIDGLTVRVPMIEIRTVGAGGGSIAHVEAGGGLRVGPRSAGAEPGPVAYGRGGTEPAVTDANLVLGRLDPAYFLGGAMALDLDATRAAIDDKLAGPLALGAEAAAAGVLAVANVTMGSAIRLSLFEKGADPRDFTLVAFGGAGGLHAIDLARELEIGRVIFPADPATLSARGILFADIMHDFARSRLLPATLESLGTLGEMASELGALALAQLEHDGIPGDMRSLELAADMRYRGQAYELLIEGHETVPSPGWLQDMIDRFHVRHQERFAHNDSEGAVEIVTLRLRALGRMARSEIEHAATGGAAAAKSDRRVFDDGEWRNLPVYGRAELPSHLVGPAIVEEEYTTIHLPAGWRLQRLDSGDLVAEREDAS